MRAGEDRDEVPLEGLYGPFGFLCPFVVRGNALVGDMQSAEVKLQSLGSLVVKYLELDGMPEVDEPCVATPQ